MAGFLARLLGGPVERKAVAFSQEWLEYFGVVNTTKAGLAVTTERALQCTTALACGYAIACGVAMLPGKLYRPTASGGREEARDLPVFGLLDLAPNDWQTSVEFIETLVLHAVFTGNGYSFINRVNGEPRELIPLVPTKVEPKQLPDFGLMYRVSLPDGTQRDIPRRDILHLRGPGWDGYQGLDAVRLAREAIGLALATEETHSRLHSNAIRSSGILQTEASLGSEDVDLLRKQWEETQGGLLNTMKPIVLTGGLKWEALSMTGVDSQHLETRRFQIEEICRAMGVFPQMVGHSDKTATFASAEAFFLAHVVHTLSRWTRRIEKRLAVDLLTPEQIREGLFFKFSFQALLRGDSKARADFYRALVTLGIMTRNEARALEEMNPIDGLDEPLTPLNLGLLEQLEAMLNNGDGDGARAVISTELAQHRLNGESSNGI